MHAQDHDEKQDEVKVPKQIRLQRDAVDAKGGQVRKGETVEVGSEEWPEHRALRFVEKEFAVDSNDPDIEEEVKTLDDASGLKRHRAKGKKKR